jgi:PhzF family phenazine biosynthesis protein
MSQKLDICIVNAFANESNSGSPTGVVLRADGLTAKQMLKMTQFLDVSHTAFVSDDSGDNFSIRFFTKEGEIKNCAHATIAANFLRATKAEIGGNFTCNQKTIGGEQRVEIRNDKGGIKIFFVQDEIKFKPVDDELRDNILNALGLFNEDVDTQYPVIKASAGNFRILMPLKNKEVIKNLRPDFLKIKELSNANQVMGCFTYTMLKCDNEFEAYARMFAPAIGVNEDIINGNSCGCLAAYLLLNGDKKKNELKLTVQQGHSFHRAGTVLAIATKVNNKIETMIGGNAVLSWQGEFNL